MEALSEKKQARCLLISGNTDCIPYPVYPIGVAHLMGALRQHGHLVDHFDILACGGAEELAKLLSQSRYDVIGVSIRNIDTVDSSCPRESLSDIKTVVECARKHSDAPLVLGGPGFSIMPAELLEHLQADYGIVGEGEVSFPNLVDKIISGEEISERLFAENLSTYPDARPDFSSTIAPYYISHGGMLNVQTKRGCNYGCTYCSYPTIEGQKLRHRDPVEVAEEIERLVRELGARYIFFTDGVFNDPDEQYLLVAEELIRKDNTTPWCAFFRPQNLDQEKLRILKKSGMAALELGTDAASNQTLKALRKGFTIEEVIALNQTIASENIPCAHFIMFGGPDETEQTVLEGLKNIEKFSKSAVFAYIGIRILPGTKIYQRAIKDNIITEQSEIISPVFYYSPLVSRDFIDQHLRQSFQGRKDRIYPMAELEVLVPFLHSMGKDGPLWELLIDKKTR